MTDKLLIPQQWTRDQFARLLKAEMILRGVSIAKLAEKSGVSISAIVSYRNSSRDVPLPKLVAMARALDMRVRDLFPDA